MPPRASAAEKGKGPAKRGAKRGADDALSLADLLARCTRADLEALLLEHEDDLPDLQKEVEARLQPEQVRVRRTRIRGPPALGRPRARAAQRPAATRHRDQSCRLRPRLCARAVPAGPLLTVPSLKTLGRRFGA